MCSTKRMLWRNWKCWRKMWNPASANLTFDFIKTVLHHGHVTAEYFDFFWKSCFTKYLWLLVRGVSLFSDPNQILFVLIDLRKANSRNKNIRRKLFWKELFWKISQILQERPLMKSFLDKLQHVPFEEELHHKSFLLTFTKFWRALLSSCFKEIVNKRKTDWEGSQLTWYRSFICSSFKRAYCSLVSDLGYILRRNLW